MASAAAAASLAAQGPDLGFQVAGRDGRHNPQRQGSTEAQRPGGRGDGRPLTSSGQDAAAGGMHGRMGATKRKDMRQQRQAQLQGHVPPSGRQQPARVQPVMAPLAQGWADGAAPAPHRVLAAVEVTAAAVGSPVRLSRAERELLVKLAAFRSLHGLPGGAGPPPPNPGVESVALRQGDAPSGTVVLSFTPGHPWLLDLREAQEQGRQLPPPAGGRGEPWAYTVRPSRPLHGAAAGGVYTRLVAGFPFAHLPPAELAAMLEGPFAAAQFLVISAEQHAVAMGSGLGSALSTTQLLLRLAPMGHSRPPPAAMACYEEVTHSSGEPPEDVTLTVERRHAFTLTMAKEELPRRGVLPHLAPPRPRTAAAPAAGARRGWELPVDVAAAQAAAAPATQAAADAATQAAAAAAPLDAAAAATQAAAEAAAATQAGAQAPGAGAQPPGDGDGAQPLGDGAQPPGAGARDTGAGAQAPGAGAQPPGDGARDTEAGAHAPGAGPGTQAPAPLLPPAGEQLLGASRQSPAAKPPAAGALPSGAGIQGAQAAAARKRAGPEAGAAGSGAGGSGTGGKADPPAADAGSSQPKRHAPPAWRAEVDMADPSLPAIVEMEEDAPVGTGGAASGERGVGTDGGGAASGEGDAGAGEGGTGSGAGGAVSGAGGDSGAPATAAVPSAKGSGKGKVKGRKQGAAPAQQAGGTAAGGSGGTSPHGSPST